ncbi:MAG: porin [Sheuella sp.]|nr:porin [Sheuella sp.]
MFGLFPFRVFPILCLCLGGAVHAQSELAIYGTLDMGIAVQSTSASTSDFYPGGSNFGVISGGQSDNRVGFRGYEELGGGTRATFDLENAINLGNGTLDQGQRMFGRQAWLGLENKSLGYLRFGRQRNFADIYLSELTPFGPGDFSQASMGVSFGSAHAERLSNTIKVETAMMDGFRVGLGYSFSAQMPSVYTTQGRLPTELGDTENYNYATNNNMRVVTTGVQYYNGPVYLTATYDAFYPNAETAQGNFKAVTSAILGGMYDFNLFKVSAAYGQTRNGWMNALQTVNGLVQNASFDNTNSSIVFDNQVSVNSYMIGLTLPTNEASDLFLSWQMGKPSSQMQQSSEFAIVSQSVFSLGYAYKFTPLTNMYIYAGYASNYSLVEGLTNSAFGIGIRHRF